MKRLIIEISLYITVATALYLLCGKVNGRYVFNGLALALLVAVGGGIYTSYQIYKERKEEKRLKQMEELVIYRNGFIKNYNKISDQWNKAS